MQSAVSTPVPARASVAWRPEAIRFGVDPLSGAEVEQLTSDAVTSTNIYPEQRFASADGSRIAISRQPFGAPNELWVCDLRSLRLGRIGPGKPLDGNAPLNAIYYTDGSGDADTVRLMRLDLMDLTTRVLFEFDELRPTRCAVSADEKYAAVGPYPVRDNVYALHRIELATGQVETLCEMEDIFNPHLQFERAASNRLMVQVNRGGRPAGRDGGRKQRGELGGTLCVVDVETREVTPLPAGRPHTPRISGHECWVGNAGRIIFTAGQYQVTASSHVTLQSDVPQAEQHLPRAAIYIASPGDHAPTVLAQDRLFNHLAASDDGQFFIGDDHPTGRIYVGSIATGRSLPLCDSHTRQGACQHSHVHAYMTPDNRHVIFNSIVTGVAQVYAAHIPDGFLARVLEQ